MRATTPSSGQGTDRDHPRLGLQRHTISGGPFGGGGTVNFLFVGKQGNDTLTGFSGNDTLKGGGGNDTLRGVGGDDTMLAAAGNDRLFGGGGTDIGKGGKGNDTCSKVEIKTSCGKRATPQLRRAGRGQAELERTADPKVEGTGPQRGPVLFLLRLSAEWGTQRIGRQSIERGRGRG